LYPNSNVNLLKASTYNKAYSVDYDELGMDKPDSERESAQFLNSIQLSAYSGIGLVIGIYLVISTQLLRHRIIGILLSFFALCSYYFSSSRGVLIGLIIGVTVILAKQSLRLQIRVTMGFICCLIIFICLEMNQWLPSVSTESRLVDIIGRLEETGSGSSDNFKINAILELSDSIIEHPLFGFVDVESYVSHNKYFPHQAPLSIAVLYGWIPGICTAIIIWLAITGSFTRLGRAHECAGIENNVIPTLSQSDINLSIICGWIVIVIALTNHNAGKLLQYIFLGYACLPWIYRKTNFNNPIYHRMGGQGIPSNWNAS
jgi:hypothetical protein